MRNVLFFFADFSSLNLSLTMHCTVLGLEWCVNTDLLSWLVRSYGLPTMEILPYHSFKSKCAIINSIILISYFQCTLFHIPYIQYQLTTVFITLQLNEHYIFFHALGMTTLLGQWKQWQRLFSGSHRVRILARHSQHISAL